MADVIVTPAGKKLSLDPKFLAGVGRAAILAGQSNEEVVATLAGFHGVRFPEARHHYYARWYRAQLVMLGVLPETDPRAHVDGRDEMAEWLCVQRAREMEATLAGIAG